MRKNNLIVLVLLFTLISCKNSHNNKINIDIDLNRILQLILLNNTYFNNKVEHPRVFYTTGIKKSDKIDLSDRNELARLLTKNNINKLYFYSRNEVWFVFEEKELFLKKKEYLIGFTKSDIKMAKINQFNPSSIESLNNYWYSLVIKNSIVD